MVAYVTASVGLVYYETARRNMDDQTFKMWMPWLVVNVVWFFYMAGRLESWILCSERKEGSRRICGSRD